MLILAIDPGKARSLARRYRTDDATHEFRAVLTRPPWIPQHRWR